MSCFKISNLKAHLPVYMRKGAKKATRNLLTVVTAMRRIVPSATLLKRMSPGEKKPAFLYEYVEPTKKFSADFTHQAEIFSETEQLPTMNDESVYEELKATETVNDEWVKDETSLSPLPAYDKTMLETLQRYKFLTEKAFFENAHMADDDSLIEILNMEVDTFPMILEAFNEKNSSTIKYVTNSRDILNFAINNEWRGRQLFLFNNSHHTLCVDLFKDQNNNISVITIDSLSDTDPYFIEKNVASTFIWSDNIPARVSIMSLKTNVQKNMAGCKFFSLHFAKTAMKNENLLRQHKENISRIERTGLKPHYLYDIAKSEAILDAHYYKHAHSLTRLDQLPPEKKAASLCKHGNIIERTHQFRVQRTDKKDVRTFSNSIDHFRRKQIDNGEAFLKARLV